MGNNVKNDTKLVEKLVGDVEDLRSTLETRIVKADDVLADLREKREAYNALAARVELGKSTLQRLLDVLTGRAGIKVNISAPKTPPA